MQPIERTLRGAKDYGIKIAKKGYDARTAASNQLLYSSSFPVLQIVDVIDDNTEWEVVRTGKTSLWMQNSGQTRDAWQHIMRFRHGVGFPPMLIEFGVSNTFNLSLPISNIKWDNQYIYSEQTFYTQQQYDDYLKAKTKTPKFIICAVDISTDIEYPYLDSALDTEWGEVYDYGIKHLLTDDEKTTDPTKLGLNANIQSQLAIAVKIAKSSEPNVSFYTPATIGDGDNTMTITLDKLSVYAYIQDYNGYWSCGGASYRSVSGYRITSLNGKDGYALDGQYFGEKCSLVAVRQPMISSDLTRYNIKP